MKERHLQDQTFWEQQESERIEAAVEERKLAVANQERLGRMKSDKDAFLEKLMKERNAVYKEKAKEFEKMLAEEKKLRMAERRESRKEERRNRYYREKEEEEERKHAEERRREEEEKARLEEIAKKEREEQEKIAQEEREKRDKEQRDMLERVAAKKRQKEEEIEKKLLEQQDKAKDNTGSSSWRKGGDPKEAGKPVVSADSWRRGESKGDEPKKVEAWKRKKQFSFMFFNDFKHFQSTNLRFL